MLNIPLVHSLRFRIVVAALAIEALILGGLVWNGLFRAEQQLNLQLMQHVHSLELAYRPAVTIPLVSSDYATLRDTLDGWRQANELKYIQVQDPRGKVLATSGSSIGIPANLTAPLVQDDVLHAAFPVAYLGQQYGKVLMGLDTSHISATRQQLVMEGIAIALTGLLLTALLLVGAVLWITRHLRTLTEAAASLADGEYATRVIIPGNDEVGVLAKSFNTMAGAVEVRVQELAHQAGHDPLTGLHNRRAFESFLDEALRLRGNGLLHVLYLDLDQFKAVNDSCGHAAGDLLLQSLAKVMRERFGADFIARLGGDEFGMIILNRTSEAAREHAEKMMEEIRSLPFAWEGKAFQLGASVGMVQATSQMDTVAALLIAADTACYAAKEHGRNRVEIYEPDDAYFKQRIEEFDALARITSALQEKRLTLFYQRIQPLTQSGTEYAEVLVRMRAPDGKLIPPGQFIPAAERYNLMPFIDRWVIEATFVQLAQWRQTGHAMFARLNINLSGATLAEDGLRQFIRQKMSQYDILPAQICFEITESQAIGNLGGAMAFIEDMRKSGITIALDDFGSGLSSFGYLKRFHVDSLKIDGQFVHNLARDPVDRATVAAMVGLAKAHGLRTVAEYVAEPELIEIVRSLGVDYAQGYAVHIPEAFTALT